MKQPIPMGVSARDFTNPFSGDHEEPATSVDDELAAMDTVMHVLEMLEPAAQRRALTWVADRLGVPLATGYPIGVVPAVPRDPFTPR